MIDSSFRNQASTASAMNFLQFRSEEQAKPLEGVGEGKRLIAIGDGETSKIAAIGEEAIKQIKIVELIASAIQNGNIKIVPDVLVTGGNAADGLMGMLTKLLPGADVPALLKKPVPGDLERKTV